MASLIEDDVVRFMSEHLVKEGFTVEQSLSTTERGIDIVATHADGRTILAEAKGATSSKLDTKRYGKSFTYNQVQSHIGRALIAAFRTKQEHNEDSTESAIVLPGNSDHRRVIDSISKALMSSGISIYFVAEDGGIEKAI